MTEGMVRCEGWQVCRDSACYHRGLHHPMSACDNACQRSRGHSTSAKCKPIGKIMSEKQTGKPKVRTVIGKWKVKVHDTSYFQNCDVDIARTPIGTLIELVAILPAKSERRVVPGPGEWKRTQLVGVNWHLINESGVIASISQMGCTQWYWETLKKCGHVETHELAERAAEEALATSRLCGFRWEEAEPEYIRYMITVIDKDGDKTWRHPSSRENAEVFFNLSDRRKTAIMVLAAQDGQLNWHELDRYEAEEKP